MAPALRRGKRSSRRPRFVGVDVIVDGFVVVDGAVDMSATMVDDSASERRSFAYERGIELVEASVRPPRRLPNKEWIAVPSGASAIWSAAGTMRDP